MNDSDTSIRMKRSRLSTLHDFEYAIKWESIRTNYFRAHGQTQLADQSTKYLKDLQWRCAIEAPPEESLTHASEELTSQSIKDRRWSTTTKTSVLV